MISQRLQGARLVTAIEINEGQRLSEALIKSFTGGDRITAKVPLWRIL